MPSRKPTIYVIAGCNGAGKTTFAKEFLLKEVDCPNFLNADYLALGLSPLSPELAAMKAGRLLLTEFKKFIERKESFALESTLSGLTYLRLLRSAGQKGFTIHIHFLWLPNPANAIARVRERVQKGGHNVPSGDIRRRFHRGLVHFIDDYAPLAEWWAVWNNFKNPAELLADRGTCSLTELKSMLMA
jgi:predicted ABC-type ATPase